MKCPSCDLWVDATHTSCPSCGTDVSALRSLQEFQGEVRRTRSDSEWMAERLKELDEKLSSIVPLIKDRIAAAKPGAAAEKQTEPVTPPTTPPVAPRSDHAPPWAAPTPPTAPPPTDPRPSAPFARAPSFSGIDEIRFGQKWLLICGLVITVLAVGYFLKYSFDRNWVGPTGRVALAYVAAAALLIAGELFRQRSLALFGLYLIGAGIAVLYFSTYAAFQIYDLIGQTVAFGLMVLVTALAGALSLVYDTKWLAVLGIIGGFLTPVVLSTGVDNQVALMTYMVILSGGILVVGAFKQWSLLTYLGFVFTWMLFAGWYARHYAEPKFWVTTVFLNVFFLIYTLVPFAYYFLRVSPQRIAGFFITVPNAFIALGFSFAMIRAYASLEFVSVVTVSYAALFFGLATYLRRRHQANVQAFILLLAKGQLFLVVTIPILFSANWITVFWAVQAVALLWAALRLGDQRLRGGALVLMSLATLKFLLYDYTVVFELRVVDLYYPRGFALDLVERGITSAAVLATLFLGGRMSKAGGLDDPDWRRSPPAMLFGSFAVVLFITLNIEVAALFHEFVPQARFASISVLWTLFSVVLMALGFLRNQAFLRWCSLALFAVTVGKVFLRDMANVNTPYRILSFLVLGLMLVGVSFLYHRFKAHIRPPSSEEKVTP